MLFGTKNTGQGWKEREREKEEKKRKATSIR
jgi:hypothetical protein